MIMPAKKHQKAVERIVGYVLNKPYHGLVLKKLKISSLTYMQMQTMEPGDGKQAGITHTTKVQVEKACLEEARWRFTQANWTPFLQPPLLDDFGEISVDWPASHAVLEGRYKPPPGCNPAAIKILAILQWPPTIQDIDLGGAEDFNHG